MKYPKFLSDFSDVSFMNLPKAYQEFFIRMYYYVVDDRDSIPDTVPVEHIEAFIVKHVTEAHLWQAKGFAAAKLCTSNNSNRYFNGDATFCMILFYASKLWYTEAVDNKWIKPNCTKKQFEAVCPFFNRGLTL